MRSLAARIAAVGFFTMAGIGIACRVPVFVCAMRALAGAAVLYVLTAIAGKAALGAIVDAMVKDASKPKESGKRTGERSQ